MARTLLRWSAFSASLYFLAFAPVAAPASPQAGPAAPAVGGQKYAVIIGINRYEDDAIGDLRFAVADARAVHRTLTDLPGGFAPENVRLLTDDTGDPALLPTRNNVLAVTDSWLRLAEPRDTVLIYFSGHGFDGRSGSYLAVQDSIKSQAEMTGVALSWLKEQLDTCRARRKILIVDACHSGSSTARSGDARMGPMMARELAGIARDLQVTARVSEVGYGMSVLTACGKDEQSFEWPAKRQGVFTYFLVEGLRGAADSDRDGIVDSTEASEYTYRQVRRWAAEARRVQTPMREERVFGTIPLVGVPAPGTGSLALMADAAAEIYVDGEKRGTPPLVLRGITTGPHTVLFRGIGSTAPAERTVQVEVKPGATTPVSVRFRD